MITSQGFGMGALVNFEFKMSKALGMIVRQSIGYYWMVKRLSDGQNLLILERDMEVVSEARGFGKTTTRVDGLGTPATRICSHGRPSRCEGSVVGRLRHFPSSPDRTLPRLNSRYNA